MPMNIKTNVIIIKGLKMTHGQDQTTAKSEAYQPVNRYFTVESPVKR